MRNTCLLALGAMLTFTAGCSHRADQHTDMPASSTTNSPTVSVMPAPPSPQAGSAPGTVRVVVDGQSRPVQNTVDCVTAGQMVFVNIGSDDDAIAVTLTAGDPPLVKSLTLGHAADMPLLYSDAHPGPAPEVTKTGSNYRIAGTLTGPQQSEQFELEFTCPPEN